MTRNEHSQEAGRSEPERVAERALSMLHGWSSGSDPDSLVPPGACPPDADMGLRADRVLCKLSAPSVLDRLRTRGDKAIALEAALAELQEAKSGGGACGVDVTAVAERVVECLSCLVGPQCADGYNPSVLTLVVESFAKHSAPERGTGEVDTRHVIVPSIMGNGRGLVRSPAILDLASFGAIEAVEVDGEPLATRTAIMTGLGGKTYRRRKGAPNGTGLKPGPRTLGGNEVGDVVLHSLSHYALTGDERAPIRGDIYRLALASFAISGPMTIPPELGAIFIGGGDTKANRTRWWDASRTLNGLTVVINDRTGEWRNLAMVDVESDGVVHIAAPAWWKGNDKWRLAGGLFRPLLLGGKSVRGTKQGYWGGLARTIASIEAVLSYGPSAGRGQEGRIPDRLRCETGKTGPGPVVFISWLDVLRLAGEHVDSKADSDSAEAKRWQRRRDALKDAGYVVPRRCASASAGDTVEVVEIVRGSRTRPAGLLVRASERFVQATRKAHDLNKWTRVPASRLFREAG